MSTQVGGTHRFIGKRVLGRGYLGSNQNKDNDWPQEGLEEERPRRTEQQLQALKGNELLWVGWEGERPAGPHGASEAGTVSPDGTSEAVAVD